MRSRLRRVKFWIFSTSKESGGRPESPTVLLEVSLTSLSGHWMSLNTFPAVAPSNYLKLLSWSKTDQAPARVLLHTRTTKVARNSATPDTISAVTTPKVARNIGGTTSISDEGTRNDDTRAGYHHVPPRATVAYTPLKSLIHQGSNQAPLQETPGNVGTGAGGGGSPKNSRFPGISPVSDGTVYRASALYACTWSSETSLTLWSTHICRHWFRRQSQ